MPIRIIAAIFLLILTLSTVSGCSKEAEVALSNNKQDDISSSDKETEGSSGNKQSGESVNQETILSPPTPSNIKAEDTQSLKDEIQVLQKQIELLQAAAAIAPKTAKEAVDNWAKGLKLRNGALQYAVLTSELKEKELPKLRLSRWTIGQSSPWVNEYTITPIDKTNKYEVVFSLATSTGNAGTEKYNLSVKEIDGKFFISEISRQN